MCPPLKKPAELPVPTNQEIITDLRQTKNYVRTARNLNITQGDVLRAIYSTPARQKKYVSVLPEMVRQQADHREQVAKLVDTLPTMAEVARRLGVSRQAVDQHAKHPQIAQRCQQSRQGWQQKRLAEATAWRARAIMLMPTCVPQEDAMTEQFHRRPSWNIHRGDALAQLASIPGDSITAVITDPPYSSGGAMRSDRNGSTSRKYTLGGTQLHRPEFAGDNRDPRSYLAWCSLWLAECLRVTQTGGVCVLFSDWRQLPTTTDALQAGGWVWRGIVPWDKTESARPDKGRFRNQCEYAVWGSKGPMAKPPKEAPCLPGVVRERVKRSDKYHIAGKPTALMQALVKIAWQGGTVLDPFCGSGTTGVAAIQAGLDFIGIEMVGAYAVVAEDRCQEAVKAATQRQQEVALGDGGSVA